MTSQSKLSRKVEKAEKVIEKALHKFNPKKSALAWTGGKDSTVLLWIARRVCENNHLPLPCLIFINEGDVFPEIKKFVNKYAREWHLSVISVQNDDVIKHAGKLGTSVSVKKLSQRNQQELSRLGFNEASFPFEPESFVGNHLMKTVPMNMFLEENHIEAIITGIRKDEQEARSKETIFSERHNPDHFRVHPILHFTEQDIWDTIHAFDIPYVSLYKKGYRSLGAKSTTTKVADIPAWKQDLKGTKEREGRRQDKEKIMDKLRKLGYM